MRVVVRTAVAFVCSLAIIAPLHAQISTGTIAGTITDEQGGVLPGATIVLISETQATRSAPVVTNENGDFVLANVRPDSYVIEITMSAFKTLRRGGVAVSPGQRVALGSVALQLGGAAEVITVTAEVPLIQTQSGERSFTIDTEQVASLPTANRNFIGLASLTPGVTGTTLTTIARIGSSADNNVMMDGVSTNETGSNRGLFALNVESIGEIKVLTSGYQAEFGRSSGLQISTVTKSGTNQFRGSLYDVEHNSNWDANSRTNILNGDPKTTEKRREAGFSIGGPIGRPGGNNKLFFFYAEEFAPRTGGNDVVRFRFPTELERRGDFSQTTDQNGNPFPYIWDSLAGPRANCGTTPAGPHTSCFQEGGVLGRIPQNRLYQLGVNVLKMYPSPNLPTVPGQAYNFELTRPEESALSHQPVLKIDYQPTGSMRAAFKIAGYVQTDREILGTIPGWNDSNQIQDAWSMSSTFNYTLNPTTFLEAAFGRSWTRQGGCTGLTGAALGVPQFCRTGFYTNDVANRNNIGLGNFPFLFPDGAVIDDPDYLVYRYLQDREGRTVMWDGRQITLPPSFTYGNRVTNAPPNRTLGMANAVWTTDVSISLSKVVGSHTLKTGFYNSHSSKYQGGNSFGLPTVNFGNDTANPIDSQFGFANAALGIFTQYQQRDNTLEWNYIFNNTEGFIQDNWKVSSRWTLDYGVRLVRQQPAYDGRLSGANFFEDKYSLASAPVLYVAGCTNGAVSCTGNTRAAMDPRTGRFLTVDTGASSVLAIGQLVPGSGDQMNGLVRPGDGIVKTFHKYPLLALAPRFGTAYDVSGVQKLVVRGGVGLFFDRPAAGGCGPCANPPTSNTVTVRYSRLDQLGNSGLTTTSPPTLSVIEYERGLPSSLNWNGGVQMALPLSTMLDVTYTGEHGYNLQRTVSINAVDIGTAFLPQNTDRTQTTAAFVPDDQMRPYRGYAAIQQIRGNGWRTYHGIQFSLQHRMTHGISFGFNDSIALHDQQDAPLRLQHTVQNGVVTTLVRADQERAQEMFGDNNPPRHTMKGNFVWQLPRIDSNGGATRVLAAVANDWQLSGIWTGQSGTPYTVGYTYTSGGANVNLTGSADYAARVRLLGDQGNGCSDDPYRQFNTAAFAGPLVGSDGLESGSNYLKGCFQSTFDLSIARTIRVGGARNVQLRIDMFNAFNAAAVTARNTTMSLTSPADPVNIQNLPFDAAGNLIAARSRPRGAGFGVATNYQTPRAIQAQVRFQF